jgi:STE24 endopeptidase
MQLAFVLAVLAALMVAQCGPLEPVSGGMGRLAVAAGGVGLLGLWALGVSLATARRLRADFSRHRLLLRRFCRLRQVHTLLWLLYVGGISYGLDWARLVRFNWHLEGMFLLDELLILLPVLLPLVLSWAAFYEVDKVIQSALAGRQGAEARLPTRREYLSLQVRHYLGVFLLPLLGLLAVEDLLGLTAPEGVLQSYGAAVLLCCLAGLFVFFPVLLRYVWHTRPLPAGPLRSRLEGAADRAGFHAREILVWYTNATVVNAAVAGLVRRLRYVFLSDALLMRLGEDEVEAVFAHEVGHVRHHHLLLRGLAMVAPLSLCVLLEQAFPGTFAGLLDWSDSGRIALGTLAVGIPAGLLVLGLMAAYVVLVFGYYSRQLEHQADLFGCRWAAGEPGRPAVEAFTSALEKLAQSSAAGRNARSWQHASIARRIDFLDALCRDPKRELRFRRRVRLLGGMLICTVLSPLAYRLLLG